MPAAFGPPAVLSPPQSLLSAVKASLSELQRRLGSAGAGSLPSLEHPLFGVDLQLRVPSVVLHPSLDEIQEAISSTANKARRRAYGFQVFKVAVPAY